MNLTSEQLIHMFKELWANPDLGLKFLRDSKPIAESDEDQKSVTENPFWEIVRWAPARNWKRGLAPDDGLSLMLTVSPDTDIMLPTRHELMRKYSYPVISPKDIEWMTQVLDGSPLVEIGAGNGYLAWQMRQLGIKVAAYDKYLPSRKNHYCGGERFTDVIQGDAFSSSDHSDSTLLISWPPPLNSMAFDALNSYKGEKFIYCGWHDPQASGDDQLYETLENEWELFESSSYHVNWYGIHSHLMAYRRK